MIGLRGRYNERGEFLIATTLPADETVSPTSSLEVLFPHFAVAGGYNMGFVLYSGRPEGLSGAIYFFDKGGNPVELMLAP